MKMKAVDDQETYSPIGRISTPCKQRVSTHSLTQHHYHLTVQKERLILVRMSHSTFALLCSLQI